MVRRALELVAEPEVEAALRWIGQMGLRMAVEGMEFDCFEEQVVGCIGKCLTLMAPVEVEEPGRIEELGVDIEKYLMVAGSVYIAEP